MNNILRTSIFIFIISLAVFLRFYNLTSFPPAPYWEEVALGYDAYSLSATGKDHHGNSWPVVAIESFGDWKPSGYFYVLVPFIKTFGLSLWSVRLPSTIAGVLLVLVIGKLAQLIYTVDGKDHINAASILPVTCFVVAISPWAIQFSRAAWEVNLATFFLTLGILLSFSAIRSLDGVEKNNLVSNTYLLMFFLPATILFVFAAYTYHSTRFIAPFMGFGIVTLWFYAQAKKSHKKTVFLYLKSFMRERWRVVLFIGFTAFFLFLPIIMRLKDPKITQRFAETSILSEIEIIQESNTAIQDAGGGWISKIIYHRYLFYGRRIVEGFLSHFSIDFLFVSGDVNLRHSTNWTGQLYHIEALFLLLGLFWLGKHWNRYTAFLVFWLIVGIVPAALTKTTPHALRILPVMPVFLLLISFGIQQFFAEGEKIADIFKNSKTKKIFLFFILSMVAFAYGVECVSFWRYYSKIYPKVSSHEWQYGYEQMIEKVHSLEEEYPNLPVYISREAGRPAMYYWFYTQTSPNLVQQLDDDSLQDQSEYLVFENRYFIDDIHQIKTRPAIVAVTPKEMRTLLDLGSTVQDLTTSTILDLRTVPTWEIAVILN